MKFPYSALLILTMQFCGQLTAAAGPASAVDELRWMAGDWRNATVDEYSQEVWLEPVGGNMSGVFRFFTDGELVLHEYIFVAEEDGEVLFRFRKHFPDDATLDEHAFIVMKLVAQGEQYARFENIDPNPEEPRVLAYERKGDSLTITVIDPPGSVTDKIGSDAKNELVFEFRLAEETAPDATS